MICMRPNDRVWAIRLPPWKARTWSEYSDKLIQILSRIRDEKLTLDDVVKMVRRRGLSFRVAKQRIRTPLILCGLVDIDKNGYLHLTDRGKRFLQSKSKKVILEGFERNVWGFKEIKEVLSEKELSINGVLRELRRRGARWRKMHQVRRRLRYLMLLGAVERKGLRYRWVGIPPTHEELKDMLMSLGKKLGYAPRREFHVNEFRVDVAWLRSEIPGASAEYVFEVQLGGNPKSAILNLQECLKRWRVKPFIVTSPDQVSRIKKAIQPWGEIKVIDYRKLEEIHEKLDSLQNLLKEEDLAFNLR